ncbi:unnamed protein product, partial [Protopolystoma xenopodis]
MLAAAPRNVMRLISNGTNELPKAVRVTSKSARRRSKAKKAVHVHQATEPTTLCAKYDLSNGSFPIKMTSLPVGGENEHCQFLQGSEFFAIDPLRVLSVERPMQIEDKIDSQMRFHTLSQLRAFHLAYYDLLPITFCKTVTLLDSFVAKVKVKPVFALCVTAA